MKKRATFSQRRKTHFLNALFLVVFSDKILRIFGIFTCSAIYVIKKEFDLEGLFSIFYLVPPSKKYFRDHFSSNSQTKMKNWETFETK